MLADLPEFRYIESLAARLPALPPGWLGIGDDCAVVDGLLVTSDASVEFQHFRLDWSTPSQAMEKALLSNLSDINAMGGTPLAAVLTLCLSKRWDQDTCNAFAKGAADACQTYGVPLVGGDTVRGEVGTITFTLLGRPGPVLLRRSDARPGDVLYLSGALGGSAAGLRCLQSGLGLPSDGAAPSEAARFVGLHQIPHPPLGLGPWISGHVVRGAAIDLSDGLSSELNHIASASQVALLVDWEALPLPDGLVRFSEAQGYPVEELVLHGGEDYQLLLALPGTFDIFQNVPTDFSLIPIGRVAEGRGVRIHKDGQESLLVPGAWSHL